MLLYYGNSVNAGSTYVYFFFFPFSEYRKTLRYLKWGFIFGLHKTHIGCLKYKKKNSDELIQYSNLNGDNISPTLIKFYNFYHTNQIRSNWNMMHWLYSDVFNVLYVHILSMTTDNIYPNKKMTDVICS